MSTPLASNPNNDLQNLQTTPKTSNNNNIYGTSLEAAASSLQTPTGVDDTFGGVAGTSSSNQHNSSDSPPKKQRRQRTHFTSQQLQVSFCFYFRNS